MNWVADVQRDKPYLKVVLLVLVILLLAFLAYRVIERARGPKVDVWVASDELSAGSVVEADDLEAKEVRAKQLPAGTVTDRRAIEGRQLVEEKPAGEPFVATDLARAARQPTPPAQALAELIPAGRVLTAVRVAIDLQIMDSMRFGDRFDLVALNRGAARRAVVVARDAFFVAWVDPRPPTAAPDAGGSDSSSGSDGLFANLLDDLQMAATPDPRSGGGSSGSTNMLLALYPQDVLPATAAESSQLRLVLHGKTEVQQGQLLDLDGAVWTVELLDGARRGRLEFTQ